MPCSCGWPDRPRLCVLKSQPIYHSRNIHALEAHPETGLIPHSAGYSAPTCCMASVHGSPDYSSDLTCLKDIRRCPRDGSCLGRTSLCCTCCRSNAPCTNRSFEMRGSRPLEMRLFRCSVGRSPRSSSLVPECPLPRDCCAFEASIHDDLSFSSSRSKSSSSS